VDQIDLQILKLLQQRNKLARRIGEAKRRHHGLVYVPERERELLRRLAKLSRGKLPATAITAIFREILSSSRAEQGQAAIGLLQSSAPGILWPARACFGACDKFLSRKTWSQLAEELKKGSLALVLLTGADLGRILKSSRVRRQFCEQVSIVGDFIPGLHPESSFDERIFIITPRREPAGTEVDRILILMECKSSPDALKTKLTSMPGISTHAEKASLRVGGDASTALVRLTWAEPVNSLEIIHGLQTAGVPFSLLGVYQSSENYAG